MLQITQFFNQTYSYDDICFKINRIFMSFLAQNMFRLILKGVNELNSAQDLIRERNRSK